MAQFFYDGQIRRYLVQVVRLMSNFLVKRGDGTLEKVPVMYGDMDRQAAAIINQNSENTLVSAPRIAVYMSELSLDRERLADATFVGKVHIRERDVVEDGSYGFTQGSNYTVERLMPTPYRLKFKVDIWTTSTEQKLQLVEQILMLFNPSLEIQTTDNYIDWTSLSVVDLVDISTSSRTVPVGTQVAIDIATLTLETPIWISPPAKVKRLGIVTNIIMNVFNGTTDPSPDYIEGLGTDVFSGDVGMTDLIFSTKTSVGDYDITVNEKNVSISSTSTNQLNLSWTAILEEFPGKYVPGLLKIYLKQPDGSEVLGYGATNPFDDNSVIISDWDPDTYPRNNPVPGPVRNENAWGSFDAVIDPTKTKPDSLSNRKPGSRYLIVDNIGGGVRDTFITNNSIKLIDTSVLFNKVNDYKVFVNGVEVDSLPLNKDGEFIIQTVNIIPSGSTVSFELYLNEDGPDAWKNVDGSDFIADANDIIEWDGNKWHVIFSAKENSNQLIYQTNIFTLVQYKWNGITWVKSFDGEYKRGEWRLEL